LAFESERQLAKLRGCKLEEIADIDDRDLPKEGIERERMVHVRANQHFFRAALSAYDCQCCITGLAVPKLLVASHIVPWADDPKQRMNPRNGLCLNALQDRAFDRHLMFFDESLSVRFRNELKARPDRGGLDWLLKWERQPIRLPRKFKPDPALIKAHAAACR
jgi:putative restriction endonuclease